MNRNFVIGGLLIAALVAVLSAKCYRELTVGERKMEKANALLRAKDFTAARAEYQAALQAGGNRLICLGSIVECDFGIGRDKERRDEADEMLRADAILLSREDDGKGRADYFLGIMHRRNKEFELASYYLQRSDRHNFPLAVVALANLRKGG